MPFDFKKYRKVHTTPHHSIFRHQDGHEIKVIHSKLDGKLRNEVMNLGKRRQAPVEKEEGYAQGGEVEQSKEKGMFDTLLSPIPGRSHSELPTANPGLSFDDKGQPYESMGSPDMVQPAQAPEAQATLPAPENVPLAGMSPQQPQGDIYGTQAYMNSYEKGIGEQKAGLRGEAQALGEQGKAEAELVQGAQKQQADLQSETQKHFAELETERQGLYKDLVDGKIDPNHYMGSMDTGSKVTTAIGLILGGIGGGLTGQENPVLGFLNKQIDRDIQAQQANLNKKESLLNANMKHFGNLKDAADMTRVMMMDGVKLGLQKAAAQAQDPLAKQRALQAIGKIDQDSAAIQSQLAARKALTSSGAAADPSVAIRMLVDPKHQDEAYKELKAAQNMGTQKKELLSAFDQLQQMGSVGRTLSPHKAAALREPLLAQLVKDSEGRITPQDTEMIRPLFPQFGDSDTTTQLKRHQLDKFISEKMNFPVLDSYGLKHKSKAAPAPNLNAPKK